MLKRAQWTSIMLELKAKILKLKTKVIHALESVRGKQDAQNLKSRRYDVMSRWQVLFLSHLSATSTT